MQTYGLWQIQVRASQKGKGARKKQKIVEVKEVKLRPNIENHDFETKARNAQRFLRDGDKVKVTIMFRGREITHTDLGKNLCLRFAEYLKDDSVIEREPKVEGRNMVMILAPSSHNTTK